MTPRRISSGYDSRVNPWLSTIVKRYWLDAAIVAFAMLAASEVLARQDAEAAPDLAAWLAAALAASIVFPLLLRRKWNLAGPTLLWVLAAGVSFLDGRLVVFSTGDFAAGMTASCLLGFASNSREARLGLVVVLSASMIIMSNAPDASLSDYFLVPGLFAVLWLAGFAVQQRTARLEAAESRIAMVDQEREQATRDAITSERTRMARELHDVLGHSLSVMTIQAAAVRTVLTAEQINERDTLLSVEQTGREAMSEMRRLVGILRGPNAPLQLEPQPGLGQLNRLFEQSKQSGLPVELTVEGDPAPLPPGVELTAYRLIQEGLTNTRKHSSADRSQILVRYQRTGLEVQVRDNGTLISPGKCEGQGLIGLRERVAIYGGVLEAGPSEGGGFRLRAWIPVELL